MIEDGYFVSFFSKDEAKKQAPRSIVVIKDGKVAIHINPKADEDDKNWLSSLKKKLSSLENDKKKYEFEAASLESFWDWNGYTPNPSDYIEPDKYDGKYDALIEEWN